jgi:16S rRNA (cytosine1402-N4)-methyltransferase
LSVIHDPVLVRETLAHLLRGPGLYLDATLGDGGHAEAVLRAEPGARLLGCDRDREALDVAGRRLAPFGDRVMLAHASFRELPTAHREAGGEPLAGALLDLGLSSRQIDQPERGMSFSAPGPLDLRMDSSRGEPAAVRLTRVEEAELIDVLERHGDVHPARRLARALLAAAHDGRLTTTSDLAEIVRRHLGGSPRNQARVFQALRIWINEETEDLEAVLAWLPSALAPGAVVVTLAYHSGEDRIIKRAVRGEPEPPSRRRPVPPTSPPEGPWDELTRKVVRPGPGEVAANPRARSARLRAFRRKAE